MALLGLDLHAETPRMCGITVGKSRAKCVSGRAEPGSGPGRTRRR